MNRYLRAKIINNLTAHIDYPILSRPFPPIYQLHRYWGRKPWNIIGEYIKNYTKEGDVILDVFSGSGVGAIETLKLGGRRVITVDINPIAAFIAKQSVVPVDLQKFETTFEKIASEVRSTFCDEYYTTCRTCGNRADVIHFKWGREKLPKGILPEQAERDLLGLRYRCQNCETVADIPPNEDDRQRAKKDYIWVDKYLNRFNPKPLRKLVTTRRSEAGNDYFKLFTQRNLFLLCVLYDAIQKVEDDNIRDIVKLVFTSALDKSSRLLMYTEKGVAHGGVRSKSWVAPRFHIQRNYLEKNPLLNFRNSFDQVFKGKKESNKLITDCRLAESVENVFNGTANVYITNSDIGFLDELPADSINYAIVDPPFVEDIRYLELSQLWNNWLGIEVDWKKEIQLQPRRLDNYFQRLNETFQKIHRVLEPDKYLTVIYHTEDINLWDIMVKASTSAGFRLCKLVPQGVRYSYGGKYRTLYSKSLEGPSKKKFFLGHYYLTFARQYGSSEESTNIEEKIINRTKELIQKRNEPTPLIFILLNLYEVLSQSEQKELSVERVIDILNNFPELQREKDRSNGQMWEKWSLTGKGKTDQKMPLREEVKNDLAEMLLFERNRGTTYYIQGILNKFKGELIVSSQRVKNLLDELSLESHCGNVIIRELNNESEITIHKEKQLTESLINLGKKYDFKPDFIPELGVMWEKEDRPLALFHILILMKEDSLERLSSMVQKLNQIALDRGGFRRVLVIPERLKEDFLRKSKEQWDYVLVEDLELFLKKKGILERAIIREKKAEDIKKKRLNAKVIGKEVFAIDGDVRYFKLIFETGYIERHALAGQFVNILCHPKNYRDIRTFQSEGQYYEQKKREKKQNYAILRRPMSIHRIYYEHFDPKTLKGVREIPPDFARLLHPGNRWRFDILVKVVGLGTIWLSQVKVGETVDMIGPLGNSFTLNPDIKRALIVGGGIGIAPLYALAERLRWEGKEVILFLGAYEEKDLRILGWDLGFDISYGMEEQDIRWLTEEFKQMDIDVKICTMEGRSGERVLVTEIFKKYLRESRISMAETEVFSCGPRAMLKNLASITKEYKLRHQVLLEEVMGCGIGACLSCACPVKTAEGGFKYKRVCTDGPVFNADEVDWNAYKIGS